MFAIVQEMLERNNGDKEEMKNLKYAHTYLQKYINELIKRVGYDEGQRIKREAEYNNVKLVPRVHEEAEQMVVDKESMEGIAEICLKKCCFGCERHDWNNCPLYKYMRKLEIETIYGFEDRCMYWYPKGGFKSELTEEDLRRGNE
jgi:hypothetical protein